MSSQGPVGATGYTYQILRDAQDRTRQIREQLTYTGYSDGSKKTFPSWDKLGNGLRLSYNFGRLSCSGTTGCPGVGLSDVVPLVPAERSLLSYLSYEMYVDSGNHLQTPIIGNTGTWGTRDDTLLLELLTSDIGDDGASVCTRSNPNTIIPRKVDSKWDYINLHITGFYTPPVTGSYIFSFQTDDGVTIKIDGTTIVSLPGYGTGGGDSHLNPISLTQGVKYPLEILWSNGTGGLNFCMRLITVNGIIEVQDTYPFTHSCSPA